MSTLDTARSIARVLISHGKQAFLVGGCVRDTLLNLKPKDFDVATDARPNEVLNLFPDSDQVGAHFGVIIHKGIEIATFRSDSVTSDGRRPDHVVFENDPKADASRRDFTINAMFMDPFSGEVLDFFGGQEDLEASILRAVGNPVRRFEEDHLRMMRAVRFAVRLGFRLDPNTRIAIMGQAERIKDIAVERTTEELRKALAIDGVRTISILADTGLLEHVLPEVAALEVNDFHLMTRLLSKVKLVTGTSMGVLMATLFLKTTVNPVKLGVRMKLTNDEVDAMRAILALQGKMAMLGVAPSLAKVKRVMRSPHFADALALFAARVRLGDLDCESTLESLLFFDATLTAADLQPVRFVNGDDLIDMGFKPSQKFKDVLDRLEDDQLSGVLMTREEALAAVAGYFA